MANTRNQEDIFTSTFEVSLGFGDAAPPHHSLSTVFVFISLGRLFSIKGPPRGGTGSGTAFIIITSATTEICYLRLINAAQTHRDVASYRGGRQLGEIVSKKRDERERK